MFTKALKTVLLIALFITWQSTTAQIQYSRVKIELPNGSMQPLLSLDLDLDHGEYNKSEKSFISTLHHQDILKLRAAGVKFNVLVEDEINNFQKQLKTGSETPAMMMQQGKLHFENSCISHLSDIATPAGFITGSYGGYYTYAEMLSRIDSLVNHYPSIVHKTVLPQTTAGGRQLVVVKISDNASINENEPELMYTGLHHAREGMSMMNLFYFMQYLAENYATNDRVKALVDNRELFFIPCVNPDGYVFNELNTPGGGGMWRKNRRNNGGGNYGVDLNRNYNVDWGVTGPNINISTNPSSDSYIGPSAFSEPETQAIRQFSQARHFKIVIDHHAYGNYYVTPYGVPASHPFTVADERFYKYASALMGRYNGYFAGDGMETVAYYAVGNSRDYHMAGDIGIGSKQKTYGYTVEIGPSGSGFWPSPANIIPIARSMFFANLQMAYMAGAYYEIQDRDRLAINTATGNFNFSLLRTGISTGPVTVNIIPLQNVQSTGTSFVHPGASTYGDSVHGSISYTLAPGIAAGDKIRFIYEINTGGIILQDTVEKIYQPVTVMSDNLEGSMANWTFTNGWGSSMVHSYSGTRSISESPSGNYISSRTSSATYNIPLNLSDATAAYLSFWVRHRAENGDDKLQIQISPSGPGAGSSFSSVCGRNTIAENSLAPSLTGIRENWTRETIDLENYLGSANIGLRFLFTSNSGNNDDGFYIDDIEIVKSDALVLAPVPTVTGIPVHGNTATHTLKVYPNPAVNKIQLSFSTSVNKKYNIRLSTVAGQTLQSQNIFVNGKITREINLGFLKSQVYLLTLTDLLSGEQTVYKILKQ